MTLSPSDADQRDAPADTLADDFFTICRHLHRQAREQIRPLGITSGEARALRTIAEFGPLRPSILAEHLAVVPRSVTETVNGLIDRGWIEKASDPTDSRAYLVEVSTCGRDVLATVNDVRHVVTQTVFAGMDPLARSQLRELARQIEEKRTDR